MQEIVGRSSKRFHGFLIETEVIFFGSGKTEIDTQIGFLDHMIELLAKHGQFDIKVKCVGDVHVDNHHTVDEVAMNLGLAFKEAVGKIPHKIVRFGHCILPMDEVLSTVAIDIDAHRQSFVFDVSFRSKSLGMLTTDAIREFWSMFSQKLECNLIIKSEYGVNDHHIAEGLFKCVARAINKSIQKEAGLQ